MIADPNAARPATLDDVPGWFYTMDRHLFAWFLERQKRLGISGDLIEMGTYMGRSAILLGDYLREGETFTVCDLFDSEAPDAASSGEMRMSYRSTLTREAFDTHYLAFHDRLPDIVQGPTSLLAEAGRITPKSVRFAHIDASHLYEHVIGDIRVAREALAPDGVVVLDDYRSEHTPGVAAAVWEAVATMGLTPIVLSSSKLYATWGDPDAVQEELVQDSLAREGMKVTLEEIRGRRVLRLRALPGMQPPPFRNSRFFDEVEAARVARAEEQARGKREQVRIEGARRAALARLPSARARRIARDLLPPIAARAVRSVLRGKR
ncbi:class I SAM-dependent methyltransferase [Streptacidiphilus sp. EB129]|uniref:class I SAM-dependent methyltransferase n=1 Tax=Streptacidiphilus sp. EB129 TaxID=3156262 RepID=UPI003518C012